MRWSSRFGPIAALGAWACADEELPTFEGVTTEGVTGTGAGADLLLDATEDVDAGRLRLLHLSPDADRVDVYLDDDPRPIARSLSFLGGTAYREVPAGRHTLTLAPRGAGPGAALVRVELGIEAGGAVSAAAVGTVERGTLDVLALTDDDEGIGEDERRLRLVHAADPLGPVDLWDLSGPSPLSAELAFGASALAEVARGPLSVGLDLDEDRAPDWRFVVPDLGAADLVNLYAVATSQDGPSLVAHLPDGTVAVVAHDPRVRVLHASPGTWAVDLYARGVLAFRDLAYAEGSPRLTLAAGTYPMDVLPAGTRFPGASQLFFQLPVRPGRDYTVVLWGGRFAVAAPVVDGRRGLPPGWVRLQLVHGADGAPALDVLDVGAGATLLTDLRPGDVARIDLPGGPRAIGLDLDRDGAADRVYDLPDLGEDVVVDLVAVTELDGVKLLAQLPDDRTLVFAPR